MSQQVQKKKRDADPAEQMKRIRAVQEYILMNYTSADIINQCVVQWGICERQAYRYYRKAYENWEKITEKEAVNRRNYHIHARMRQIRNLPAEIRNTVAGQKLILEIQKDIASLEGMYVKKFEHTGKDGESLNMGAMTDEQFEKLLNDARANKIDSD